MKEEKDTLVEKLKHISFKEYRSKHRKHFKEYRDKIIDCSYFYKSGALSGRCVGELYLIKNKVMGDWALDKNATYQFDDQDITDAIEKHIDLIKSLVFEEFKKAPTGTELIFGQLYTLATVLYIASTTDVHSHKFRVALLAIDPENCNNENDRFAFSSVH